MPKTNTKQLIIDFITTNKEVTPKELVQFLEISPQAFFRHIKKLINTNVIEKIGSSPKVYYRLSKSKKENQIEPIANENKLFLKQNFYFVSPIGQSYSGLDAMIAWCNRQNLPIQKTINEYKKTLNKYNTYKKNAFINGIEKIQSTFKKVFLDNLFYLDFYAIERFGKTKLGYYLLYSKQGQSLSFMNQLIAEVKPQIESIINMYSFDAIAFVPPTVKREIQIMKLLEERCSFGLKIIKIDKLKTPIIVPQKTLSKLSDRIYNAKHSMIAKDSSTYKHILLVDDAVGSGATLNEIAFQLKDKNICKKVTGLALVGSFKGFDVISEV